MTSKQGQALPMPWENRAALVAMTLLCLQWLHEGLAGILGFDVPGEIAGGTAALFYGLPLSVILIGLFKRHETAWWCAMVLCAGIGAMMFNSGCRELNWCLWVLRNDRSSPSQPASRVIGNLIWTSSRLGFHFAVPVLLLLGQLRKTLVIHTKNRTSLNYASTRIADQ